EYDLDRLGFFPSLVGGGGGMIGGGRGVNDVGVADAVGSFGQPGGDALNGDGQDVGARAGFDFRAGGDAGSEGFPFLEADANVEARRLLRLAGRHLVALSFGSPGGIGNLRHDTGKFAIAKGVDVQARFLSDGNQDDIDFTDIHAGFHVVQICHSHNLGAGHHGSADHPLADLGGQATDGAIDGSDDSGFGQFLHGPVEGGLGDIDLVFGGAK